MKIIKSFEILSYAIVIASVLQFGNLDQKEMIIRELKNWYGFKTVEENQAKSKRMNGHERAKTFKRIFASTQRYNLRGRRGCRGKIIIYLILRFHDHEMFIFSFCVLPLRRWLNDSMRWSELHSFCLIQLHSSSLISKRHFN